MAAVGVLLRSIAAVLGCFTFNCRLYFFKWELISSLDRSVHVCQPGLSVGGASIYCSSSHWVGPMEAGVMPLHVQ